MDCQELKSCFSYTTVSTDRAFACEAEGFFIYCLSVRSWDLIAQKMPSSCIEVRIRWYDFFFIKCEPATKSETVASCDGVIKKRRGVEKKCVCVCVLFDHLLALHV